MTRHCSDFGFILRLTTACLTVIIHAVLSPPVRSQQQVATEDSSSGFADINEPLQDVASAVVSALHQEALRVDSSLRSERGYSRAELLSMYGQSSAASGEFRAAAASNAILLKEFGASYETAMLLADCLAPFDLSSVEVLHPPEGPQFQPHWQMQHEPSRDELRLAVGAYRFAARLTKDSALQGQAHLKKGWVLRALGDWTGSTSAWDECAAEASEAPAGPDCLWLAAQNLFWTDQLAAAKLRLNQFLVEYPNEPRAEAGAEWLASIVVVEGTQNPVLPSDPMELILRVQAKSGDVLTPYAAYRSIAIQLRRRGQISLLAPISRWAITQTAWPMAYRIRTHYDLIEAISQSAAGDKREAKQEIIELLGSILDITNQDDWAVPAAVRRSRLLSELGRFGDADETLLGLDQQLHLHPRFGPLLLGEKIRSLLDRGDLFSARDLYNELSNQYPEHDLIDELAPYFTSSKEEK